MTTNYSLQDVRLLALGGAKSSTNGEDDKPLPEPDDRTFDPA